MKFERAHRGLTLSLLNLVHLRRDGYDEVIYPLDHKVSGHIVDDEL
jgi:hypothetical protein